MFRDQVREVLNQTNPKMFLKRRAFLVELDQDFLFYMFGVLYPRRQIDVVVLAKNRLKVRQTYNPNKQLFRKHQLLRSANNRSVERIFRDANKSIVISTSKLLK